jgi:hypothetical protein
MRNKEDCFKYQPEIKTATKANSFVAGGRVIYLVKKNQEGRASRVHNAYDKDTKILLASHWDKEYLIKYLQGKDLSCLGNTQGVLF